MTSPPAPRRLSRRELLTGGLLAAGGLAGLAATRHDSLIPEPRGRFLPGLLNRPLLRAPDLLSTPPEPAVTLPDRVPTGSRGLAGLHLAGSQVYVVTVWREQVVALRYDLHGGAVAWRRSLPHPATTVWLVPNLLVVTAVIPGDSLLVTVLDTADGRPLWSGQVPGTGPPDRWHIFADRLVVDATNASGYRGLVGLDLRTGTMAWFLSLGATDLVNVAAGPDVVATGPNGSAAGSLMVLTGSGRLWLVDPGTGAVRADRRQPAPLGSPTASRRGLVFGTADSAVWSLDPADLTPQWTWQLEPSRTGGSVAALDGLVLVQHHDQRGQLTLLLDARDGRVVHRLRYQGAEEYRPIRITHLGHDRAAVVAAAEPTGVVDMRTGQLVIELACDELLPVAGSDGLVAVGQRTREPRRVLVDTRANRAWDIELPDRVRVPAMDSDRLVTVDAERRVTIWRYRI